MIRFIRPIGNSCGLIIDKAVLDLLNLRAGSPVDVTLAPEGKGILITPAPAEEVDATADADAEKAARIARVREAAEHVRKKQTDVFKRLAE